MNSPQEKIVTQAIYGSIKNPPFFELPVNDKLIFERTVRPPNFRAKSRGENSEVKQEDSLDSPP